jgi:hypothetical protein
MSRGFKLSVLLTVVAVLGGVAAAEAAPGKLANPNAGPAGIEWRPVATEMGLVLTVSGPQGFYLRQEFGPGQTASFSVFDSAGAVRPAGSYMYELRAVPQIDEATRTQLQAARESGTEPSVLGKAGRRALEVQSGAFAIADGSILMGGGSEPGAGKPAGSGGSRIAPKDQVIPDDLIVQGSICAGLDCVNNENFGFDTIRMKENNTRIDFTDTSTSAGFPSQDWEIAANDSASGGRNALIVSDENNQIFVIESGNVSNALYVDDAARIGLRTSNPVLDLHIATSNTPGIRLEQTSAGGFTAQTWDIAGNEANFFVRDVTGGSLLPFRIRPGAPTSSVDISADGDVGIGTASPSASLHVSRSDGTAQLLVEETSGTEAIRQNIQITNNGRTQMRLTDTSADGGNSWFFGTREGAFQINEENDAGQNDFILSSAGSITIPGTITTGGSCSVGCDRVFDPDFDVESIEEHAAVMWANRHLPGVGPTPEEGPFNLTEKTTGMLNELEKAHIYIDQLHGTVQTLESRLGAKEGELQALGEELAALKTAVEEMRIER